MGSWHTGEFDPYVDADHLEQNLDSLEGVLLSDGSHGRTSFFLLHLRGTRVGRNSQDPAFGSTTPGFPIACLSSIQYYRVDILGYSQRYAPGGRPRKAVESRHDHPGVPHSLDTSGAQVVTAYKAQPDSSLPLVVWGLSGPLDPPREATKVTDIRGRNMNLGYLH